MSAHDAAYQAYLYLQLRYHAAQAGDVVAAEFAAVKATVLLREYVSAYFEEEAKQAKLAGEAGPVQ